MAVLMKLNPIIRGWANYYRTVVASKIFTKIDYWMWNRTIRYLRATHPKKPWPWRAGKYFGRLNPKYEDNWVFGDKQSGRFLLKFSWFKITRHALVKGTASPDDPSLREYWWERRKVNFLRLSDSDVKLAEKQDWRCPVCGMDLNNGEELHRHHKIPKGKGGQDSYSNRELVHLYCHHQRHEKMRHADGVE